MHQVVEIGTRVIWSVPGRNWSPPAPPAILSSAILPGGADGSEEGNGRKITRWWNVLHLPLEHHLHSTAKMKPEPKIRNLSAAVMACFGICFCSPDCARGGGGHSKLYYAYSLLCYTLATCLTFASLITLCFDSATFQVKTTAVQVEFRMRLIEKNEGKCKESNC